MVTIDPPCLDRSGCRPTASSFKEKALVRNAVIALSQGVFRKLPPRASGGAKAMAWTIPSRRPQRSWRSSRTASMSSRLFTSSSRMSGIGLSLFADISVMLRTRPKLVSTISAPSFWATSAIAKAIDCRVRTPVTSSFLPSRIPTSDRVSRESSPTLRVGAGGDREVLVGPVAPGAHVEPGPPQAGQLEGEDVHAGAHARAAVHGHLGAGRSGRFELATQLGGGEKAPVGTEQRAPDQVPRAGDVAGFGVDRLDLATVSFARPRVDQESSPA